MIDKKSQEENPKWPPGRKYNVLKGVPPPSQQTIIIRRTRGHLMHNRLRGASISQPTSKSCLAP